MSPRTNTPNLRKQEPNSRRISRRALGSLAFAPIATITAACGATEAGAANTASSSSAAASTVASDATAPPTTAPPTTADPSETGRAEPVRIDSDEAAVQLVGQFSQSWLQLVGSAITGNADSAAADQIASLADPQMTKIDPSRLADCVTEQVAVFGFPDDAIGWEQAQWQDHGMILDDGAAPALWSITVLDEAVLMGADVDYNGSVFLDAVVGDGGMIAIRGQVDPDVEPATDEGPGSSGHVALADCLTTSASLTSSGEDALARADAIINARADTDLGGVAADGPRISVIDGVLRSGSEADGDHTGDDTGGSGGANADGDDGTDKEYFSRPGFPADPADPEPIKSTGANKWDLITTDDPTAFERLESLGTGTSEFLPSNKEGGFQSVEGAYLYRAYFSDDTTVEIRLHPDIGTQADADAEVQKYLIPLGQLPTLLRRDIGQLAVIVGDNTARASYGEGITVQTENMAVRIADRRLEETLFHESVHTSLDENYSYQQSAEWLDAQEADGRFIAEYARENPDGEDLAETALYAFALTYHPDRFPDGMADQLRERVPHRLAFIEQNIFPADQPWIVSATDS